MAALKIIFMGTPDFAVGALAAIHAAGHDVIAVYSQPPRPKGRGQQVQNSPVHEFAAQKNIPVFTPKTLRNETAQGEFASLKADIAVVAAYGLLLPKAILDAPKYGCLNIHASLLPRWRGASPIQQSILAGDAETGITIMQMDEGLDTGPMIVKEKIAITGTTTATSLHDDLSALGAKMIVKVLSDIASNGAPKSEKQDDAHTIHAPLIKKEDGKIDWSRDAAVIDRQIRALNPWPGTGCMVNGKRLKIKQVAISAQKTDAAAGTVLEAGHVACGNGTVLQIKSVQPDNAKSMDFASAQNGGYIREGDILE